MRQIEEGVLLRVFVNEGDKYHGQPLYEKIVKEARAHHLAGATVTRGILGYGADSRMHTTKVLRLSEDLPVIVEIFDKEQRVNQFVDMLDAFVTTGMMTLEKVKMFRYPPESC